MDFRAQQLAATRDARRLRVLFAVCAICAIPFVCLTVAVLLSMVWLAAWTCGAALADWPPSDVGLMPLWPFLALLPGIGREFTDPGVIAWLAIELLIVLGLPALVLRRMKMASAGDHEASWATQTGSTVPGEGPFELREAQLEHIVEEMSLAAGCAVPGAYVWEDADGIHSFIDAYMRERPAIHVSRGALHALTREELQALVAHQLARIANFDQGVQVRMGLCAFFGYAALRFARWKLRKPQRNPDPDFAFINSVRFALWLFYWPFVAVVWVGGSVQLLLAWLFSSAVMRAQVRRADAFALQFTRNPGAIKSLLMKAAARGGNLLDLPRARDPYVCFASATPRAWFDSHPGIAARLRAVDRHFRPAELADFLAAEQARKKYLAMESPEQAAARHVLAGRTEAAARARASARSGFDDAGLHLVDEESRRTPPE